MNETRQRADRIASLIEDGSSLLLAPDYSGCAMAVIAALIRRNAKHLRLIGAPQLGLQAELLIATGCVARVETAAISLGEAGIAPSFEQQRRRGDIEVIESTCPAIHAGLMAAERAVPFAPVRGIIGSDLLATRDDWKVVDNPYPPHDPILIVPVIEVDSALFHAPLGDRSGNIWIGVRREMMLMAHAARRSFATVEAIQEDELLLDQWKAPGVISSLYIDHVELIEGGAKPMGSEGRYPADPTFSRAYRRAFDAGEGPAFIRHWAEETALAQA